MIAWFKKHTWVFVVVAFAILISAWVTLLILANKYKPESIPLENRPDLNAAH